ncbi:HAD family hydrolase [Embleya sp. NPDC050154]|uniref:HAD family hydrolase n=1 Tax=Embleya sp. NPDC050154 TaxID=3363988 RepID=UPI0037BC91B4
MTCASSSRRRGWPAAGVPASLLRSPPAAVAVSSGRDWDAAKPARVFDVVVVRDDVARGKPAPDIFLRAAGLLGVPARCCVVFEDADTGIAAALAAGMRVTDVRRHLTGVTDTRRSVASRLSPRTRVMGRFDDRQAPNGP